MLGRENPPGLLRRRARLTPNGQGRARPTYVAVGVWSWIQRCSQSVEFLQTRTSEVAANGLVNHVLAHTTC